MKPGKTDSLGQCLDTLAICYHKNFCTEIKEVLHYYRTYIFRLFQKGTGFVLTVNRKKQSVVHVKRDDVLSANRSLVMRKMKRVKRKTGL